MALLVSDFAQDLPTKKARPVLEGYVIWIPIKLTE
jgi:hypothetical protein